jgi:hypothetical protein
MVGKSDTTSSVQSEVFRDFSLFSRLSSVLKSATAALPNITECHKLLQLTLHLTYVTLWRGIARSESAIQSALLSP